jgi:serine/threonine protein kinase
MGEVYRARDTRLERDVAIKVLGATFAADADRVRRFTIEAQATGALNHPNILAVYDIGTHEGAPYLVTELLEGETLRARIDADRVPRSRALELARQVASGLAAAHAKGITHRDIKPENLFVTTDGARRSWTLVSRSKVVVPIPTPPFSPPPPARAWCWARSGTCRPNRSAVKPRTRGPTSSASASSSMNCCRVRAHSSATRRCRR